MNLPDPPHPHQLNWSYFKPEFSGKTEEDAMVHLLKTNDWMKTHNFPDDTKVNRFCLTLSEEARLCYESIKPIEMDWNVLQECFRQQYSKFGSSREQYFHVWRSFHYDENTDTIDFYILKIKQVASLLNYGEPEILELFKNTLPSKLYWIFFPINNLREAVDTTKRVLNKEKLDKKLTGQASSTSPFMKIRDTTHSSHKVLMKLQDLETVTSMMHNMSLQQGKTKKPFKPRFMRKEEEVKDKIMTEIDLEIMIGRDKALDKTGAEMIIEGMDLCKTLVEIMAEIEVGKVLIEVIVVIGVDQGKEACLPGGIIIITGKRAILD